MRSRMTVALTVLGLMLVVGSTTAQAGTGSITLKFHLPFAGTVNTPKTGFKITNAGSGNGLEGDSTGGTGSGVVGTSNGGNAGVWGSNSGSGIGVLGHADAGGLAGVYATASGSVTGVWGTSGGGNGVRGDTSGSGNGVYGASPDGYGVYGTSTTGYGAGGVSSSGFAGLYGTSGRNGVYGVTSSGNDSGVFGENNGTGYGIGGHSANGVAGIFVGGGSNPAIELQSGGIKVQGAGQDTATPAFIHNAQGGNLCGGNKYTILANPFLNGNPNAIVMLTGTNLKPGYGNLQAVYNTGFATGCPTSRWLVSPDFNSWDTGYFNTFFVLVIDY